MPWTNEQRRQWRAEKRAGTELPPPDVTRQVWRDDAACKDTPEWWWFAPYGEDDDTVVDAAAALCAVCPVRKPCLEHALVMEEHGFWANTTPSERRVRRKRAGIRLHVVAEIPMVVGIAEVPPPTCFPDERRRTTNDEQWLQRARRRSAPDDEPAPPIWAASSQSRGPSEATPRGDQ